MGARAAEQAKGKDGQTDTYTGKKCRFFFIEARNPSGRKERNKTARATGRCVWGFPLFRFFSNQTTCGRSVMQKAQGRFVRVCARASLLVCPSSSPRAFVPALRPKGSLLALDSLFWAWTALVRFESLPLLRASPTTILEHLRMNANETPFLAK